jgi:hypothetical protein
MVRQRNKKKAEDGMLAVFTGAILTPHAAVKKES